MEEKYRARIKSELTKIAESRELNLNDLKELKLNQPDILDKSDADENIRRINRRLDQLKTRSHSLQAALARLSNDTYGDCISCGVEIEEARLDLVPEASRCPHCEDLHFKKNVQQFGVGGAWQMHG